MSTRFQRTVHHTLVAVLRSVGWIVPVQKRSEWYQEWQAELWYAVRECFSEDGADPPAICKAVAFCLGAFQDAVWLRRRAWQKERSIARIRGSPWAALCFLITVLFATWGMAHFSPRVALGMSRVRIDLWRASNARRGPCDCALDQVAGRRSLETARLFFDGFSHYAITREPVTVQAAPQTEWTIAHAGPDVFAVLHLRLRPFVPAGKMPDRWPKIVLSHDLWIRSFAGNPNVGGAHLRVGDVDAMVGGVAFGPAAALPGKPDAWLLGPDTQIGSDKQVFIVGDLTSAGYFDQGRWAVSAGGICLALLALPFLRRPATREFGRGSPRPSLAARGYAFAFLIAKIATVLAIAWYASVDLGCSFLQPVSRFSGFVQFGSAFALSLTGLNWTFRDSRQRCPVYLRRMAHPVEVGQPSRIFLGWSGTEWACERGHTLLHVPANPTSWFSAQRWISLDPSWQFLFSQPGETSSGW